MVRLGDVFKITSGGTPEKKKIEYYQNGTIPWVKTGDLKEMYVTDKVECITELGLKNSSAKLFPKGTVLLAMYGATIGACSILSFEATTNQACAAFLPNDELLPEYLYYFLSSKKESFIKDGVGGAQPNISAGYLKNVEILKVAVEKQRAVIGSLSRIENVITKRKQQLQKLDELVKARFVELTEVSTVALTKMGDIATYINGYAFKPTQWDEKGYPIIRIQNLNDSNAPYNYYSGVLQDKYLVQNGDILISWATHLEAYIWNGDNAWLNQHIFKVVFDKLEVDKIYFVYACEEALHQAFRNAHGFKPTMEHIKKSDFDAAIVRLPDLKIQHQFADFVQQIDKSKLSVQKSLERLETLKKALMQKYFG